MDADNVQGRQLVVGFAWGLVVGLRTHAVRARAHVTTDSCTTELHSSRSGLRRFAQPSSFLDHISPTIMPAPQHAEAVGGENRPHAAPEPAAAGAAAPRAGWHIRSGAFGFAAVLVLAFALAAAGASAVRAHAAAGGNVCLCASPDLACADAAGMEGSACHPPLDVASASGSGSDADAGAASLLPWTALMFNPMGLLSALLPARLLLGAAGELAGLVVEL